MERVDADTAGGRSRRGYLAAVGSALVAGCTGTTGTTTTAPDTTTTAPGTTSDGASPRTTATSSATATPDLSVETGITYRETEDGPLKLDALRPAGVEDAPAVVFAHGGAWIRGERGQFRPHARKLAPAGYAAFFVQYRLSDVASFPAPVEDLAAALSWVRDHADRFGVDPGRVAVGGGSAGGHLAALVATAPSAFGPDGDLAKPAALLGFNGVYDVTTERMRSAELVEQFVGASYGKAPEKYRAASPVERVDGRDPPALLLHGTEDRIVPYEQAAAFREALSAAGVDVSLFTAEGAGHGFHNTEPWLSRTTDRATEFLGKHL